MYFKAIRHLATILITLIFCTSQLQCSSKGTSEDISAELADRMNDSLDFDGGESLDSPAPDGSADDNVPQIAELEAANEIRLGSTFIVNLSSTFEKPEEVDKAIVSVENSTKHIIISSRLVFDGQNYVMNLAGLLKNEILLKGKTFSINIALQTKTNLTGQYAKWTLKVKDLDALEPIEKPLEELEIENGQLVSGNLPEENDSPDVPQINTITGPATVKANQPFQVIITSFDAEIEIGKLIIAGFSKDQFIESSNFNLLKNADKHELMVRFKGINPAMDGYTLLLFFGLANTAGKVGYYFPWQVDIEGKDIPADGDAESDCVCDAVSTCCDGCNAIAENSDCNDDNACTLNNYCNNGECVSDKFVECTALDDCHVAGECNPITGQCSKPKKNDGSDCSDDEDPCTIDKCFDGICRHNQIENDCGDLECGPSPSSCYNCGSCVDDSLQCIEGICVEIGTDGDEEEDIEIEDKCADVICEDGIDCTEDVCNPEDGSCSFIPVNENCTDGTECTNNVCDQASGCQYIPDNANCNDDIDCTIDQCVSTGCVFSPSNSSCDDQNSCTEDICDLESGCENPILPNNTPCEDLDASVTGICDDGVCVQVSEPILNVTPKSNVNAPQQMGDFLAYEVAKTTVKIVNNGNENLIISQIAVTDIVGGDENNWQIDQMPEFPITLKYIAENPDDIIELPISFVPLGLLGEFLIVLEISSNDPVFPQKQVVLNATSISCEDGFYEIDGNAPYCEYECIPQNYSLIEYCDSDDNNCNGEINEGLPIGLDCDGIGECGAGILECASELETRCSTDIGGSEDQSMLNPELCDFKDNNCNGLTDESLGIGTPCILWGECSYGTRRCSGNNEVQCSAIDNITEEICDGLDNDCNGLTDEVEFPHFRKDTYGKVGERCNATGCSTQEGEGVFICHDDAHVMCSLESVSDLLVSYIEACDGIDNDCNGETDELFPELGQDCEGLGSCAGSFGVYECNPSDPTTTICSVHPGGSRFFANPQEYSCEGLDEDCDGLTDEDFGVGISCEGLGECGRGVFECHPDFLDYPICSTDIGGSNYLGTSEICDGLDNDCNGLTDDGLNIGLACKGKGECGVGVYECSCADKTTACINPIRICSTDIGGSQYDGQTEICDHLDNDCDGQTDEDISSDTNIGDSCFAGEVCGNGVMECKNFHQLSCSSGLFGSQYRGTEEICADNIDNNCDGQTDEAECLNESKNLVQH